jgi:transposase
MHSTTIAVDLAKSVFQIAVSYHPGKVAESHRLSREKFLLFFAERKPSRVVMEACGMAHFWGRQLAALGHQPVLLPPHTLRPYVSRNKTDSADAKALLEAIRNEDIHPVPIKSEMQQTMMSLHRMRSAWVTDRTGKLNSLRSALREQGRTIPVGARHVVPKVETWVGDPDSGLPEVLRRVLPLLCEEIRTLTRNIQEVEKQLRALARQMPVVQRLLSIPGVGLITATALVAFVGEVNRFPTCRHFASYLGLTPREHSSGLVRLLGRISKRGDVYLRMLLIQGARAVLAAAQRSEELQRPQDRLRAWALRLRKLRGAGRAIVALANKMARIVWALWRKGTTFESVSLPAMSSAH